MSYALGVDLGTTFTAAAICEPGRRPEMVSLGSSAYAVPSVLFLRDDGSFLAGEAASIRASSEPTRVARHFKRRIGDTVPLQLAGQAYPAEAMVTELLRWVTDTVTARQGEAPTNLVLTHPANWGDYRNERFEQAAAAAGAEIVTRQTEPEAAAIEYTRSERVDPGELIGVYDLGGGTFDAVIMRRTIDGFEVVGQPHGVERLGGLDFDEAIWRFVLDTAEIDTSRSDAATLAAAHQLRDRCIEAKRLLSFDTSANVHVVFPDAVQTVRITRSEFEDRIQPRLNETVSAFQSALDSGGVAATDLSRILLVGGSSRIPIISQMLTQEFGRPLAVDSDPKNTVALGAARTAALLTPVAPRKGPPPALAPQALADAAERRRLAEAGHVADEAGTEALPDGLSVNQIKQVATARTNAPAPATLAATSSLSPAAPAEAEIRPPDATPDSNGQSQTPSSGTELQADADAGQAASTAAPTTRSTAPRVSPRSAGGMTPTAEEDGHRARRGNGSGDDEQAIDYSLDAVSPESRHRVRFTPAMAETNPFEDDTPDEPVEVEPAPRAVHPLVLVGIAAFLLLLFVGWQTLL